MTLKELISGFSGNQKLMIGSGSSYFYAGTASDVMDNSAKLDRAIKNYLTERAKRQFVLAAKNAPTYYSYLLKCEKTWAKAGYADDKLPDTSYDGFLKAVKKYERLMATKARQLRDVKHDKYFNMPILSRKVMDNGKSVLDAAVINIIIDGDESGAMWSFDEAKSFPLICFAQKESSDDTDR